MSQADTSSTSSNADRAMAQALADHQADEVTDEREQPDTETGEDAQEADSTDTGMDGFDPERVRAKIRKQNQELRALRERAKAAEQKAEGVEDKDATIKQLQATALRYEVAFDLGLPKELAKRLSGSTKEELIADAEDLVKLVAVKRPPSARPQEALRSGSGDVEPVETDLRAIGARMFNR